ncbi:exodeoxyribonuclease V subunit gamma [Gordonia jinghuaiqii]|uniref:RecBCD enzyme subunit RecC n=1 Tax=Gordonia jinghuaiqii TaxID=2758710 RepID=A0A7D7QXU6_9ACTN|nr:exodeoxyribonuclease V subunit gamma [Gordonia jinghuaiqii]MCR5976755.1 exodeoxyribonuclease V subunit gamma [Gordonia jinghuaiqii]QMS99930.1 exodeoxyribonuclease V subunit gamma [Gordonia jinghuaiqii]
MLILHRAERTDTLADALADVISTPLADPMSTEIVSVPAAGVERWLAQHLACRLGAGDDGRADGVAANIDFTGPARLADAIASAVLGGTRVQTGSPLSAHDPWRGAELTWPVLRILDERIGDPELDVIARHIGAGDESSPRIGRRYATARHLAELFDRYGRSRPSMIADWAAGADLDGAGAPLRDDLSWQPGFWRAVREAIGQPHPAEVLGDICDRLRAEPDAAGLPERLSVFGPTRITESFRQIVAAASTHHDVHLFVPHPSPRLWHELDRLVDDETGVVVPPRRSLRVQPEPRNPLVAGLSRDLQELQLRLGRLVDRDIHHPPSAPIDTRTLLGAVQAGIRDDTTRGAGAAVPVDVSADRSVEVHACHGPERQIEVLRDRLLHLFSEDPTLQPRDVLIMCPDVETFAPLIRGAFGQAGLPHPAFDLRVRLADRGVRHVNPIVDVIVGVVELAAGRVTAGEVVDLLGSPPVRTRFAMTDDDLDLIREWLAHSNVRWGIGAAERARYGLERFRQGTFDAGLDRIALGVVAEEADDEWLGTALPLSGVESTGIDLVGRFDEFLDRLAHVLAELTAPAPAYRWAEVLIDAIGSLTATEPADDWQRAAAIRMLGEAFGEDRAGGGRADDTEDTLRLADVRDLLSALVAARPTRSNFRTGELTVCTMVPMRSVPHRVIVLLGIDAEVFPRVQRIDGDDVLGVDPLVGERNPRDEDRQCFLDAICAAQDSLLVFYSGADPVSGRRIPPAVVVSELVDTLTDLAGTAPVYRHSLHGFDARNFLPGGVAGIAGPFSHDASLLAGAKAMREPATPVVAAARHILPAPARTPDTDDIDLATLIDFHVDPITAFVRQRLGARIPDDETPHDDQLDVELDPLDKWGIGDRFLARMLTGVPIGDCEAAELRRGTLPPFAFGTRELRSISRAVTRLHGVVEPLRAGSAVTLDIVVTLPDGRRVHGTVGDVFGPPGGPATVVRATYSRLKAKQQLTGWVTLLAVAAAATQGNVAAGSVETAVLVGRAARGGGTNTLTFRRPEDPVPLLHDLVRLRDEGLRRPLPLPLEPAFTFVENDGPGRRGRFALESARKNFEDKFGASTNRYVKLAFGGDVLADVEFDELLHPARTGEHVLGGVELSLAENEPLFCGLARAVWAPVNEHREGT